MPVTFRSLLLAFCALLSACSETILWQDEVLLSSGQKIIVKRTVERIPAELGHRRAASYEIYAKYPDTEKKLEWIGSFGLSPMLLDFKDGHAFLVALPVMCDAIIPEFSVKGFPYIFMQSNDGKQWKVIAPSQFPPEFKLSNMTARYDDYRISKGKFQSHEAIVRGNTDDEKYSSGFIQTNVPRSPAEWNYKFNKHYVGCR